MEFKLSKIQETLEKSRKVLMESMELRPTTTKSSFMDRFSHYRYSNSKRPDSRTEVTSILTRNPTESEKSSTSFTSTAFANDYLPINPQTLEFERQKIHLENEVLMKKLRNTKERYFGIDKSNNISRNLTPTPVKASETLFEVGVQKKFSENSFEGVNYLRDVKKLEREKIEMQGGIYENKENERKSVKKYKKIVCELEKKLKCVTKKYENLKKSEKVVLSRNPSTVRTGSKKKNKKKVKRDKSCVSYRH